MKMILVLALFNILLFGRKEEQENPKQASAAEEQQVIDKDHSRTVGLGLVILGSSLITAAGIQLLRGRNATRTRYRS